MNRHAAARAALAIAALAGIAITPGLIPPVHAMDPGARVALETTIALSAILGIGLLRTNLERSRQLPDLLLLCALLTVSLTDFVYCAAPALASGVSLESSGGARSGLQLVVSLVFAAAAIGPRKTIPAGARTLVTGAVIGGAIAVVAGELIVHIVGSHRNSLALVHLGAAAVTTSPVSLGIQVAAAAILIVSAFAFVARSRCAQPERRLIGGASVLLAGASLQYLELPAVATNWVTPREGLRLAAYALLLRAAHARYANARRSEAQAAICSERERISRDLHDGLAQDLACIATQGQRLDSKVGPEHPLMVATRRALAASRGAIADLWASTAPSTEAALRLIADELEHRFDVEIDVRIETDTPLTADNDLEPRQREDLVRIVREAIVNAALHGTARHVDVVLFNRGRELLLCVSDDGRGITDTMRPGFGLRTMRARAASLGGQLNAYPRAGGGTELELVVP